MSTYPQFDVLVDNDNGTTTPVAGAIVEVRDITDPDNIVQLDDVVANGSGVVASASVDVDAGSILRFTWIGAEGRCGYAEEVTT